MKLCINLPEGKNNHYEIAGTELELLSINYSKDEKGTRFWFELTLDSVYQGFELTEMLSPYF